METNKICLNSGEPILGGRSDKKFSNDLNRSRYHNKKRKEKLRIFKNIDNQLHLNHEILKKNFELSKGEKDISLDYLEKQGFDPKCHLGVPRKLGEDTEPDTIFYSYQHKYRYDRESNSIRISYRKKIIVRKYIP
ncbi:hypothetical protein KA005_19030 [bacterium]|nr:hypothetical protein [bacterium]